MASTVVVPSSPPKEATVIITKLAEEADKPKDKSAASIVFVVPLLLMIGCGSALGVLAKVAQGASWLGNVITAAETGSKLFHDRHPSPDLEPKIAEAIRKARAAATALEASAKAAKAANDGDTAKLRAEALEAYGALRELLDEGIMEAKSPPGGAENEDAPTPLPFALPTDAEVRDRL